MAIAARPTTPTQARRWQKITRLLPYVVLTLGTVVVFYPFIYMLMNSLKLGREILHSPNALPSEITLTGYTGVFTRLNVLLLLRNSVFLAVSITLLNTLLSALGAYAVAKIPFPGRNQIFAFMMATMMIPGVLFLIPTYVLMYNLGWVNQFQSLIIPAAVSVYNIFLLRQFLQTIPDEQLEAARLDGAGDIGIFWWIVLPLMRPALTSVAILTFIGSWNDFFGPLLYLTDPNLWTVQVGLLQFQAGVPGENIQEIWAMITIITLPLVIFYFMLQDQFVQAFANVKFK
ncbi:carbohydrate ABC transporter permease [Oscillochloris sp. ZM17-4]|uniref:carbohydrate ABC transporter permease n=1 Tax=Oscillochloris sp. ZM17-4 TaxID=2866714 RepID=UPI001C72C80A|nr:carbohydrate ABC transporter permease [Oscillochloris sp. ZM17-4]MBX0328337.1 carbohydrate ABC transporter permease [Oscillochloris sp. ZM17-4]